MLVVVQLKQQKSRTCQCEKGQNHVLTDLTHQSVVFTRLSFISNPVIFIFLDRKTNLFSADNSRERGRNCRRNADCKMLGMHSAEHRAGSAFSLPQGSVCGLAQGRLGFQRPGAAAGGTQPTGEKCPKAPAHARKPDGTPGTQRLLRSRGRSSALLH